MDWLCPYILVRPEPDGTLQVVYHAEKLKDARYWLQYIAHAGDAVFITSKNAQYKGNGDPTYMSHLVSRGKIDYNEKQWKGQVFGETETLQLTFISKRLETPPLSETKIVEIANGEPQTLTLDELASILKQSANKFRVVLSEPTKWTDWESALTHKAQELYVIAVDKGAKWPLTVTLKPEMAEGENLNYEANMGFFVRPRTA